VVVEKASREGVRWVGVTEAPDGPEVHDMSGYVWHAGPDGGSSVGLAIRKEECVRVASWEEKENLGLLSMTLHYDASRMGVVVVRMKPNMDIPDRER
jgi:hypothetical protein